MNYKQNEYEIKKDTYVEIIVIVGFNYKRFSLFILYSYFVCYKFADLIYKYFYKTDQHISTYLRAVISRRTLTIRKL